MPVSHSSGGGRKRYAAAVTKGENAWKREWNSFISGVDMKRIRDGTTSVALKAKADLAHDIDKADRDAEYDSVGRTRRQRLERSRPDESANGDDDDRPSAPSFSYLFSSPAEKRAERSLKKKREAEAKRTKQHENRVSKHQLALVEAQRRGLKLDGMSRKQVRDFLHLTQSREQQEAQQHARDLKLYELMDDKLAWYQQGPHPIDLIAERLVARKAAKKGKRLGLTKYNYLLPHPSWIAVRMRKRREGVLVGLGKRFTFDEETGQAMDPLHGNAPVDLTKVSLLLHGGHGDEDANAGAAASDEVEAEWTAAAWQGATATEEPTDVGTEPFTEGELDGSNAAATETQDDRAGRTSATQNKRSRRQPACEQTAGAVDASDVATAAAGRGVAGALPPRALDRLLVDPTRALTTFSRVVVKDREAALVIQRANLTTHFLSPSLVNGPSIGLEDDDNDDGDDDRRGGGSHVGGRAERQRAGKPSRPKPSNRPSFDALPGGDDADTDGGDDDRAEGGEWQRQPSSRHAARDTPPQAASATAAVGSPRAPPRHEKRHGGKDLKDRSSHSSRPPRK